jgi:hypothetical protein
MPHEHRNEWPADSSDHIDRSLVLGERVRILEDALKLRTGMNNVKAAGIEWYIQTSTPDVK